MTHVVTQACVKCKYTDCVTVCPVDCFHEDELNLVIDPDVCIDCGACIPECPVQAIFTEEDIPEDQMEWIQINADKSKELPVLTEKKEPLADS
jgi:ferredoxin